MMKPSRFTWLNLFQYCRFLRLLGHIMVLIVVALVAFTWYTVVVDVYGPKMVRRPILVAVGSSLLVVTFSAINVMLLWAYLAAVATDPGAIPPDWHPFSDDLQAREELERMSYSDYYFDRRDPRRPRFCKRCQAWKAERAHHCSVSGRCILKMDHYCIWIVNCVGLCNYKFFILFLGYTFVASLMAAAVLIKPMIYFFSEESHGTGSPLAFIAVVMDGAFAVSVGGFLVMHGQLISHNCTTIEMYEKDRIHPWPYNKGLRKNLEEVFGRQKWRWLVPMHTQDERRAMMEQFLSPRLLSTQYNEDTV